MKISTPSRTSMLLIFIVCAVIGAIAYLFSQTYEFKKAEAFSEDVFYYPLVETIKQVGVPDSSGRYTLVASGKTITYLGDWSLQECGSCWGTNLLVPTETDPEAEWLGIPQKTISYQEFVISMIKAKAQESGQDLLGYRYQWTTETFLWNLIEAKDGTYHLAYVEDGELYVQKLAGM